MSEMERPFETLRHLEARGEVARAHLDLWMIQVLRQVPHPHEQAVGSVELTQRTSAEQARIYRSDAAVEEAEAEAEAEITTIIWGVGTPGVCMQ